MLPLERELSPDERDQILERVALEVTRRRLETPAILALEMHRPVTFLGSQAAIVFTPLLAPLLGLETMQKLAKLLEDRENLDRLLERIDTLVAERDGDAGRSCEEEVTEDGTSCLVQRSRINGNGVE